MATRELPSHPVEAEEQKESKGFLGKVKASGSSGAEAAPVCWRRPAAPGGQRRALWQPPAATFRMGLVAACQQPC